MAFTLDQYIGLRPFLYHVTARENLARLARTRRIDTTSAILEAAGRPNLTRTRRPEAIGVLVGGEPVTLKDQRPLVLANVTFTPGWQAEDYLQYLNEHVYFWPGDALSMIPPGGRLLAHYAPELPGVLRLPVRELLAANPQAVPLFSRYNSGAPRMQRGKPVERGPNLFRPVAEARGQPYNVIEVVFRGSVVLPADTVVAGEPETWIPIAAVRSTR